MTASPFAHIASRLVVAAVFCCSALACRSNDSQTTSTTEERIDTARQRDRYAEVEATRGEPLVVQVQVTSVSSEAGSLEATPPPAVGESATVHGEMKMRTMGSIETLARVGSDFRARANLGTTAALITGRLSRAGRMDSADRDLYRVSLDFRRDEGASSRSVKTDVELPVGQPQVVGHLEGAPSENVVLTLRRARTRSDIDSDRRD